MQLGTNMDPLQALGYDFLRWIWIVLVAALVIKYVVTDMLTKVIKNVFGDMKGGVDPKKAIGFFIMNLAKHPDMQGAVINWFKKKFKL